MIYLFVSEYNYQIYQKNFLIILMILSLLSFQKMQLVHGLEFATFAQLKLAGNATSTSVPSLFDVNLSNSSLATNSTIFAKGNLTITSSDESAKANLTNNGSIISGGIVK